MGKIFQKAEDFDLNKYYKHCFGVFSPDKDQPLREVILSFDPYQGK